ncbi:MAG: radical SAM protein [Eubacterium sp.]
MKKILLLEHPRSFDENRQNDIANTTLSSCLNTGYLASVLLEKGIQVAVVEGYMENLDYAAIELKIAAHQPEVLGIHLVYNWENNQTLYHFIAKVKEKYNIRHVTVYGYYPTFAYEEILNHCPEIDTAMLGENEITICKLMEILPAYKGLKGLAYRTDNGFVASKGELIRDLDSIPFPVRKATSYPGGEVNIFGSRGCYGGCTFCYINPYYGAETMNCAKWRGRSPENIISEIDQIIAQTDYRYFYFTDPNFYGPGKAGKERVLKLAKMLGERHIRFGIEARANDIEPETTEALVKAGLQNILVGLESGKNESLKRLNKYTTVEDNENALRVLRAAGIEPSVGFIMFEPDFNLDFLKRNHLLDTLEISVNVLYHHQIILAGSSSYHDLLAAGRLNISEQSTYEANTDYVNPQVAVMAKMMRDITNHIFDYMKNTWQLSADKDPKIIKQYNSINSVRHF